MKKTLVNFTLMISFLLLNFNLFGQADALSHNRVNGQYLGWGSSGIAGTLDIKNGTANPIDFYVGSSGAPWLQILSTGHPNAGRNVKRKYFYILNYSCPQASFRPELAVAYNNVEEVL